MIKNNKILIISIIFLTLIMSIIPTYSYAAQGSAIDDLGQYLPSDPIKNPDKYKPGKITDEDSNAIIGKANKILSVISTIGIVVSVITLMILGIKYMVGSVSEKAEYKKSMIPYIIGIILILSTSTIVGIIAKMTQDTMGSTGIVDSVPVIRDK